MKISVLMPVYRTPIEWLKQAVDSILHQSMQDFEFVIVDDNNEKGELTDYIYGITEHTCCLNIVRTKANEGLARTLDFGLMACSGDIVVRMDSDDIARPMLLEMHKSYFGAFSDRHVCGVQIKLFSERGSWFTNHPQVITRDTARAMKGFWFVNHPGVAFRRDLVLALGGYGDTPASMPEDYALWCKLLRNDIMIYNRREVLIDYRAPRIEKCSQDRKGESWKAFLIEQKETL